MSNLAATNSGEPPSSPPSSFSSLPEDLNLEILARVPRCYYPIVSCVSKYFANRVRSPDLRKRRSLRDLDSLYLFFLDSSIRSSTQKWFTLRNNPTENHFTSIDSLPSPSFTDIHPSVLAIGPEIFFFCQNYTRSSRVLYLCMLMERRYRSVGRVGDKIYVIGGCKRDDVIPAESFDLKKQIWEIAPIPEVKGGLNQTSYATASLDRKVYALRFLGDMTCYDTKDGSCESFTMAEGIWWRQSVCVIENVLYVYYAQFGLMWFDTKRKLWRAVDGLSHLLDGLSDFEHPQSVGTGEYYGKMALLWEKPSDVEAGTKEFWCRMIALDKSGVRICGTAEPSQRLGNVPGSYRLQQCLSVSN